MDKCRICLGMKKKMCSLFEEANGISYADMLISVAQVKIVQGAYNNNMCLQCCKKLKNLYNFKKEIERSDLKLLQELRILKFDNINDVKDILIKDIADEDIKYNINVNMNYDNLLLDNYNLYGNTTITKIICNENSFPKLETISIFDPGEIKYETDYDYVDLYDNDASLDYNFSIKRQERKKQRKEKNKGTTKCQRYVSNMRKVCIKPIVLDDIRVIPSKKKQNKMQKDHKQRKRQDICPYCGIMSSNVNSHLLVHIGEKKFKCSKCDKAFFTSNQLNYHQSSHLMAGAFKCDNCVAVFNNRASLQSHMVSHTDVKNHICPVCNKGFKRKNALYRHKLIHNSSAKSVKCDHCNMSFLHKQGLRHHMRVHTGERPFKCEICSQPYSYKHDFNRHCLKKHGVFLKQRSVHVMNEEVLMKERELMRDLMLRIQGVVKEGEPLNPFRGPQAAQAFDQAVKALGSCQIPVDVML